MRKLEIDYTLRKLEIDYTLQQKGLDQFRLTFRIYFLSRTWPNRLINIREHQTALLSIISESIFCHALCLNPLIKIRESKHRTSDRSTFDNIQKWFRGKVCGNMSSFIASCQARVLLIGRFFFFVPILILT